MKGSKLLMVLAVLAVVVTLVTLVVTVNKFGITGKATDYGAANLTKNSSASISFTDADCDFGSGYVDEDPTFALAYSNGTVINGTGWTGCTDGLTVSNDGNVNVSLTVASSAVASAFIGGTSPSLKMKSVASACAGTDNLASYTEVTGSAQSACDNWAAAATSQIDFELTIPEDAPSGSTGTVITAVGTA